MIRLVTAQEIKTHTSLGGNVDADKFMHLLDDVQIMVLEPILGTKLYNKILTDFDAGSITGEYAEILNNYAKPVLWHSVQAQYLRDGIVLARNNGIFTATPNNSSPADLDAIKYIQKGAQSKADVYIERLERYLCDTNLPEYIQSQDNDYDIHPSKDVTTIGGWYLGNRAEIKWYLDETNEEEV